jgi:hypothetical protein
MRGSIAGLFLEHLAAFNWINEEYIKSCLLRVFDLDVGIF